MVEDETAPRPPAWSGGPWDAPLAHRRPGYPSAGLLASRARLRFARQAEGSAAKGRSKAARRRKREEEISGPEEGAVAAPGKDGQDAGFAPGGPGLSVLL